MPFAPLQWALTSEDGRITQASGSELINMYAEPVASGYGRVPTTLQMAPGMTRKLSNYPVPVPRSNQRHEINALISTDTSQFGERLFGIYEGAIFFWTNDDLMDFYQLGGNTGTDSSGSNDYQGTIEEDEIIQGPTRMATDGKVVMMIFGGDNVKLFDIATNVFRGVEAPVPTNQSATLPDEEWVDILWADGYFVLFARNGEIYHSNLRSSQFDQLDFGRADQDPDEIVGAMEFNRRIAVFGKRSIQYFALTGGRDFAYQADLSLSPDVGCAAKNTIQKNDLGIYFLGSNGFVYATVGGNVDRISNYAVEYDIARSDTKQARAFTYTEEGHRFYSLTLRVGEDAINWTLDMTTFLWHQRSETGINTVVNYKGRNFAGRNDDVGVYEYSLNCTGRVVGADSNISENTLTKVPYLRTAIAPMIFLNQMSVRISSLVIDLQISNPENLALGQFDTDTLNISWSEDGKKTWKPVRTVEGVLTPTPIKGKLVKADGTFKNRVKFNALGQFNLAHFRITLNTRLRVTIIGVYAQTTARREAGIREGGPGMPSTGV